MDFASKALFRAIRSNQTSMFEFIHSIMTPTVHTSNIVLWSTSQKPNGQYSISAHAFRIQKVFGIVISRFHNFTQKIILLWISNVSIRFFLLLPHLILTSSPIYFISVIKIPDTRMNAGRMRRWEEGEVGQLNRWGGRCNTINWTLFWFCAVSIFYQSNRFLFYLLCVYV